MEERNKGFVIGIIVGIIIVAILMTIFQTTSYNQQVEDAAIMHIEGYEDVVENLTFYKDFYQNCYELDCTKDIKNEFERCPYLCFFKGEIGTTPEIVLEFFCIRNYDKVECGYWSTLTIGGRTTDPYSALIGD